MPLLAVCWLGGVGHLRPLLPFLAAVGDAAPRPSWWGHRRCRRWSSTQGLISEPEHSPPNTTWPRSESSSRRRRHMRHRCSGIEISSAGWRPPPCSLPWRPCARTGGPTWWCESRASTRRPSWQVGWGSRRPRSPSRWRRVNGVPSPPPPLHSRSTGVDWSRNCWRRPTLTRFPVSLDPSPFPDTVRFHEPETGPVRRSSPTGGRLRSTTRLRHASERSSGT